MKLDVDLVSKLVRGEQQERDRANANRRLFERLWKAAAMVREHRGKRTKEAREAWAELDRLLDERV